MNAECAWAGTLPRWAPDEPAQAGAVSAPAQDPRRIAGIALALGLAIGLSAAAAWRWAHAPKLPAPLVQVGPHKLAPGESYDGDPLPASHPLVRVVYRASADPAAPIASAAGDGTHSSPGGSAGLALRRHCAWGDPGRNPYRGTVEEALAAARVPDEVISKIADAVKAGRHADRLTIGNSGIKADNGGQIFDQRRFAMTYGRTLCLSTSVNFKLGHVERGSLYAAHDKNGKLHSVMVPDVCGNVSVLGSDTERTASETAEAEDAEGGSGTRGGLPGGPATSASAPASAASSNKLPLPGTLACVIAALAGWGAWRRWRR